MPIPSLTLVLLVSLSIAGCQRPGDAAVEVPEPVPLGEEDVDLSRHFAGVEAAFVLLDPEAGRLVRHNRERASTRFIPASTFKIPNSLIALETGVATGADFSLAWDSIAAPRQAFWPASWPAPQTLESAFRGSVVWFYQELARRIGEERMLDHVRRFRYGNQDISGGIDRFWLTGGLRISPDEQVEFLQRFHAGELGVSARSTAIVKDLMVLEETPEYRLGGKTGTADVTDTRELAWLVGYVERGDSVYFYALNVEGEQVWEEWTPPVRTRVVREILRGVGVLSPGADG